MNRASTDSWRQVRVMCNGKYVHVYCCSSCLDNLHNTQHGWADNIDQIHADIWLVLVIAGKWAVWNVGFASPC